MTSMPASRSARAMIFAPRSCPSRPGLAITTRILRATAASLAAEGGAVRALGAVLPQPASAREHGERHEEDERDQDHREEDPLAAERRGDLGLPLPLRGVRDVLLDGDAVRHPRRDAPPSVRTRALQLDHEGLRPEVRALLRDE